jgi:glycosyltransferase involved in cell wall biosynthesis
MKKVSILVPAFNEEASVNILYEKLQHVMDTNKDYLWEVLFVNDGSIDNTMSKIKEIRALDSRICYVDLSRNFGKEAAMLAGFDYLTGDCVVILDADLQHPPSLIPRMIGFWEEGYDDVYAKRKTRGSESWLRKILTATYYRILQKTSRVDVLQNVGDFRLLDLKCINVIKQLRESQRYSKGIFCWIGFKKKEIEFEQRDRIAGVTSWNLFSLFNLAIDGITTFTIAPLRFSSIIGFFISIIAFIYMCVILIKTLVWGDSVQGFPTLMVVVLFLGGIQLLSLGIIGEYLGRIFYETKNRPTYIAREYNDIIL